MKVDLAVTVTAKQPGRHVVTARAKAAQWGLPFVERVAGLPLSGQLGAVADAFLVLGGDGWTLQDAQGSLYFSPGTAALQVDNAPVENRNYTVTSNGALRMGAVDQLYRGDVLPTAHTVSINVTVNGQPLTQTVNVSAAGETVTYVQFAIRNGQVVPTTWTSRGTTPF